MFIRLFLFVGLTTLETFEFYFVECLNVLTTNCNLQYGYFLFIIIGDIHEFIDHCLIPIDPWVKTVHNKENETYNYGMCN